MPIDYQIDHSRRLVVARGRGVFADADVFGYQREVWTRPDVAGYDELVDMSAVEHIALPSASRVRDLAWFSATMDTPLESKMAIVAPSDYAYGLGRMLEAHRRSEPRSTKIISVFRTMPEALKFLGLEADPWKESD
jgi:hypothetical protein